jgi:hypothetical protein
MKTWLWIAGLGQLALAFGSLAIPVVLGWREHVRRMPTLTGQIFWTYAAYIWTFHVAYGLLSTWGAHLLLDGSPLARLVAAFIATYWGARLSLQFLCLDRSAAPPGRIYVLAEVALVSLFVYLTGVYTWIAVAS